MRKTTFSIQYKILLLVTGLVLLALGSHLVLVLDTFKKDKTALTFDLNRTSVNAMASELDTSLSATVDKLRLYAILASISPGVASSSFDQILKTDPLLVYLDLKEKRPDGLVRILSNTQSEFLKHSKLGPEFFSEVLPRERPIPQTSAAGATFWNATLKGAPPLLGAILEVQRSGTPIYVTAYVKTEGFLKTINSSSVTEITVVDALGNPLISPSSSSNKSSRLESPIIKAFLKSGSSNGVMKYNYNNQGFLGAYRKVTTGSLGVISEIESARVFDAITRLAVKTALFSLIIGIIAFIFCMLFSQTLTKPILALVEVTKLVASGQMDSEYKVTSRDEIGVLGESFNVMTKDLKKSKSELEETNRNLEQKVKDRTAALEEMAVKDALTGLHNRRYFNDRLKAEFDRTRRNKKSVSIVYLDIDHFKKYNDQNGHPEGDALLKAFSKILADTARKTDVIARLGGEEFCYILPETDVEGARIMAEKVRKSIESVDFPHGEKQPLKRVTCSLGVSEFPNYSTDEEDIVKSADEALYHVKEGGRNAVGMPKKPTKAA